MPTVRTDNINLSAWLEDVQRERIKLPEFQRSWTWDDYRIRGLIASLSQGYPIGAIMQLGYGNPSIRFKYRAIEGAPDTSDIEPENLILDGQQRLTSMYLSIYSSESVKTRDDKGKEIERFYYLSMEDCLNDAVDRIDAVIAVPRDRMLKTNFDRNTILDLSSSEKEYKLKMYPVNIILNHTLVGQWMLGYFNYYNQLNDENERKKALELYEAFSRRVLETIWSYNLPVIILDRETSREAVCKIFENVNTSGIVLTVFELLTATYATQYYPSGTRESFNLRDDWERLKPEVTGGNGATDIFDGIDKTTFLTAVTLYTNYLKKQSGQIGFISCKKRDVLNLDFNSYIANRNAVARGFSLAQRFLRYQFVFKKKDLPYEGQVVPLAVICALLGERYRDANIMPILTRWYWCGILGEMYGGASETRYANDVEDVMYAVSSGTTNQIRTVNAAFFSATRLLPLQTRASAVFKGIMALLYKEGCRDFMMNEPQIHLALDASASSSYYTDPSLDIHHIFPQAYCEQHNIERRRYNSIINKTPLLMRTNRIIGGNAPSKYTKLILEKVPSLTLEMLKRNVESHFVDYDILIQDDFDSYFIDRAKNLLRLIEKAMGKPITDKSAETTIQLYGQSLE